MVAIKSHILLRLRYTIRGVLEDQGGLFGMLGGRALQRHLPGGPAGPVRRFVLVRLMSPAPLPLGHTGPRDVMPAYKTPQSLRFTIQLHDAERAGRHYDIRILDGDKAYSWATRKKMPGRPGKLIQLFLQPIHSAEYAEWSGEIENGYGKGKVSLWDHGSVVVTPSDSGGYKLLFSGERIRGSYAIIPSGGNWMLLKMKGLGTPVQVPANTYTARVTEDSWKNPDLIAEEKIDGANFTARITPRGIQFVSRRLSVDGSAIDRTDNVPHLSTIKLPKKYHGALIQGEMALTRNVRGLSIAAYGSTSGILNSNPDRAVATQQRLGQLRFFPFEVIRAPGLARNAPYSERRALLESLATDAHSPYIVLPVSSSSKRALFRRVIRSSAKIDGFRSHGEGVVLKDPSGDSRAQPFSWPKVKAHDTFDLLVSGFEPGGGRLHERGVGAVLVRDGTGRAVASVGSGLTDEARADMLEHPRRYLGKVMEVRAVGVTREGNLRGPSFLRWRPEKGPGDINIIDPGSVSPTRLSIPSEDRLSAYVQGLGGDKSLLYKLKATAGWRRK